MVKGFPQVLAAQTLSATADNALLIVAIALLMVIDDPAWMTPLLKFAYVSTFVVFAAYFGVIADAFPKGRVMLLANIVKIVGCALMIFRVHPLVAYALVGFGAAIYSPAKYGILSELMPPDELVKANGWMEGLTVIAVILGTLLGGGLISADVSSWLSVFSLNDRMDTVESALAAILMIYLVSEIFLLGVPNTHTKYRNTCFGIVEISRDFIYCSKTLFTDPIARISLESTSSFWGIVASLQLLLLAWAAVALNMDLSEASVLLASVIFGVVIGAIIASFKVSIKNSIKVTPLGIVMGVMVAVVSFFRASWVPGSFELLGYSVTYATLIAALLLIILGTVAGLFLVPMDAVLQFQGDKLVSSSRSVSVQNFCEKSAVLILMSLYSVLVKSGIGPTGIMVIFGAALAVVMTFVCRQAKDESIARLLQGNEQVPVKPKKGLPHQME